MSRWKYAHGRADALVALLAVNELLIKDLLIKNDDLGWMIDKYVDDQSTFLLSLPLPSIVRISCSSQT